MRSGDCKKDEETIILDPAPQDGTGIKGVSGDLVSKVDSSAAYRVVSGSGYAEMPAKDNNMKEDNDAAAFRVVSTYGGDFISGCSLMPAKDNISFCIDLQNASSVHSSSCLSVSPAGIVLSKKDGLLASHGNVSTEASHETAHFGKVLGVQCSAPRNDIDHVIDSGGVANDAEYGQGLSYVICDGYGLHAPTVVGEHSDQPAHSPCGDIPSVMNQETMIENLHMGPSPRSTDVDLDGVIRSPVREAFPPLVVGSKHTIDGNIGSQPIAGSGNGKVIDVTPWKNKFGSKNDLGSTSGSHSEGVVREEFSSLISKNKNGSLANSYWDSGRSSDLLLGAKGVQNGVFYFEEMDTLPTEIINGKKFVKIEKKLDPSRRRWENCLLGYFLGR
ncbi:hypothetical protein AMTRI_Chr08g164950 [Amborella trichopoda]